MELEKTIELMVSDNYEDRVKAEYYQLKYRCEALATMLVKYRNGDLGYLPKCSFDKLHGQFKAMELYRTYLEERLILESIEVEI